MVRIELRDALADLDLTPVQNTALHMISGKPGSSSAELARRTQVTPQTMHKLVTDLEQRGLVTLQSRAGHGRILDAHITDKGRRLLTAADVRAQAVEDRMVAGLDRHQRKQLAELLQHCVTALESADAE